MKIKLNKYTYYHVLYNPSSNLHICQNCIMCVCVSLHIFLVLIFVHITMFVWYLGYPHTQTGKDHYISGQGRSPTQKHPKTRCSQCIRWEYLRPLFIHIIIEYYRYYWMVFAKHGRHPEVLKWWSIPKPANGHLDSNRCIRMYSKRLTEISWKLVRGSCKRSSGQLNRPMFRI